MANHFPFLRFASILILGLVLGGCATESPSAAGAGKPFIGTWSLTDGDGDLFNAVIRPDGTAITNWSKGESGAKGEFGRWKAEPGKITLTYDDGWRDIIVRKNGGFHHAAYAPGASITGKPSNQGSAKPIKGTILNYVGVWETVAVANGAPLFIGLKSDGTAAKTISPKCKGSWSVEDGAALIRWKDGWVDRIRFDRDEAFDNAWEPGKNKYPGAPTATSKAWMVGTD